MTITAPPVVGIATRSVRVEAREQPFRGVFDAYVHAIHAAGAEAVLLPPGGSGAALALCQGLLLVGGEDLSRPAWWSSDHPRPPLDLERDDAEAALFEQARRTGTPVLGICRGAQLVNCALGGQVSRFSSADDHRHAGGGADEAVHKVEVRPDSLLASIVSPRRELEVISRHATRLHRLGDGLRPAAWASDGSIEAIEADSWPFIGVQWHPELAPRIKAPDLSLFRWFVCEAERRVRQ